MTLNTLSKNQILLIVVVSVISILLLRGVWSLLNSKSNPVVDSNPVNLELTENEWVKGSASASATIVEYSDFQCPACRAYAPLVQEVVNKHKDKVRLIYRQYPLPQHRNAKMAAYSAEAAGNQGKFFEMHDLLFENQDTWSEASDAQKIFRSYAEQLKLDMKEFDTYMKSDAAMKAVDDDISSGNRAGVNATPTFYLNGVKIAPKSMEEFENLIEQSES